MPSLCSCRGCTIAYQAGVDAERKRILEALNSHPLNVGISKHGWLNCGCMTNYCDCDHSGFSQAIGIVEGGESDDR